MYFELGSHDLQVVPISRLVLVHNYEQVERVWAHDSFNVIDVGGNKDFITRPCSAKIGKTNRHVATLHWPDVVPRHLQYERKLWVGPIDECIDALHLCWGSGPGD